MAEDDKEVEIVETGKFSCTGRVALVAFPGVGMSGNIALTHIVEKLGLKEVGHIVSPETPHVVLIHKSKPAYPIRIYAGDGIVAILSELPVLAHATDELNEKLAAWFKGKKFKRLYLLGGLPNPKRSQMKKSDVYAISADKEGEAIIKKYGFKPIKEGAIFGEEGLLLLAAMEDEIPAIYLLADSFLAIPDLDAAASLIEAANKILGKKVETKDLKEKGEEVRKKFNTIIQQTKQLLQKGKAPAQPTPGDMGVTPGYR